MGINLLNNTAVQELRVVAGSTINSGDLVVNSEAGFAYPYNNSLTLAQNNNSVGLSAISPVSALISGTYGVSVSSFPSTIIELDNGTIVTAYSGNGTTASTNLNLSFRSLIGGVPVTPIVISDTSINHYELRKINSTSFVVVWSGASNTLKFAIYSNTGSVIKATTTIHTGTSAITSFYCNTVCLSNGNIVVAFATGTGLANVNYIVYDSIGNVVLGSTSVATAQNPYNIVVLPQASTGGFIVYYYASGIPAWRFARYDSAGVLQGSVTSIAGATSGLSGAITDNIAIELANGNIVFQGGNSSNYVVFNIYSSTGTLITSAVNVTNNSPTFSFTNVVASICATQTGFAAITFGATGVTLGTAHYSLFDFSGNFLITRRATTISLVSVTSSIGCRLLSNGNSGFTVYVTYTVSGCTTVYPLYIWTVDTFFVSKSVIIVLSYGNATLPSTHSVIITSDGSLVFSYLLGSSSIQSGSYAIIRKSVLGVAQQAATINQTFRVSTQGTHNINQNVTFGGSFDQRTANVPGTRGTIVGTSAILYGFS